MREIRIHGRGGQGAVVASEILAEAGFLEGLFIQAFPSFGSERRGAPVAAFVRLDATPVLIRTEIYRPDMIIVLDEGLVTMKLTDVAGGLKEGGLVLLNSAREPEAFRDLGPFTIGTVDASRIAVMHRLGTLTSPIVNTAILGAFSAMTSWVSLPNLDIAIRAHAPIKPDENVAAARDASLALRVMTLAGKAAH